MNVNAIQNADGTVSGAQAAGNTAQAAGTGFSNFMDQATLKYGDYLEQIFQNASDTYQVSKDLLKAMAKAESNFRSDATSHVGAMGIMQLMPATAASLGVTDAYDPQQNIMGGAKYISQLLQRYDGNVSYAVAAYNAGSGNVNKYGGIPPFKETQNYVAKVLQYMREGVTIPDSSGTVGTSSSTSANSASGQAQQTGDTSGSALQNLMNKYFDYEDYLEFLQLFTKIVYEKISGKSVDGETSGESETSGVSESETSQPNGQVQPSSDTQQASKPVKRLAMRIKDGSGNVNVYHQGDAPASEAYAAYQHMAAANRNRMAVYLTKTTE